LAKNSALEEVPMTEDDRKKAESIKTKLLSGQTYKTGRNLTEKWNEYTRFWESDQWPAVTAGTENYPRPVTNHFSEIIGMKVAGLTYEKPEMYFEPKKGSMRNAFKVEAEPVDEEEEKFEITPSELLVVMAGHIADFNNIEDLLEQQSLSSSLLGNGILYSYWDNTISGSGDGSFIGEICVMEIDIADFFPGDPKEQSIQKQPYIIVTERRPLKQVKQDYEKFSEFVDKLEADPATSQMQVYDHERIEQTETDYVNLVHHWERKIETKEEEIGEEDEKETITRREARIEYTVVCQDYIIRKEENYYKSNLYPFTNFAWYPKRKSFFAKSEGDDLINNQKELNRLQGIAILGAYKTGLPDKLYKSDFVKKEDLSQGPGGNIIEDMTPPAQGWGVTYLNPPQIATYIPFLKDIMAQGMKDTSGVHEAWSGKAPSAHLNASAIMALQEAAGVRIRGIQRRLYHSYKELGEIWLGYIKQYYNEDRLYKVFGKNNVEGLAWFDVDKFDEMEFDVKVTLGSASPYSKTVIASTLEKMAELGLIDGDLYLRMLPPEVFPKVVDLLELIEDRALEQQQTVLEQQKAIVDEIVSKTIEMAQQTGTEITPETLQQMMALIQEQGAEIEGEG